MKHKDANNLNFELNLLPVISLLAVLICTLMLTAVWIQIGTLNISQGLGADAINKEAKINATIWAQVSESGKLDISVKDAPSLRRSLRHKIIADKKGSIDRERLEKHLRKITRHLPKLQTALVLPSGDVAYGNIISVMDAIKAQSIRDVGIAPL